MNKAGVFKLWLWLAVASPAMAGGWRIDGALPGSDGAVTYGVGEATAYRGDWGAAVSNLAAGAVQANRTITINGVEQSLSSNLTFTVEGGSASTDTLADVTARGATTPVSVVVSNDVVSRKFMYAQEFRIYADMGGSYTGTWETAEYRAVWGACADMAAYVFCPFPSATDNKRFYPWVFVSFPGKRKFENRYSEALRIETNGNLTVGGQLDMSGYSIVNIGTNSLHFSDGQSISASTVQRWDENASTTRRVEGPLAALLAFLAGRVKGGGQWAHQLFTRRRKRKLA